MAYSILEANMERLEKKLTRIQNKCKKFGCSFTYEKVGEEFKTLKDDRGVEYQAKFILIEAEGKAVLNDWMFVASVQHTEKGNIINSTGCSIEVPERYYTSEPICEHCNSRRARKDTYDLEMETEPSVNYKMNIKQDIINGTVDELEAMKQVIYKILNTERYQYIIYSWNYGIELMDLFGMPVIYVIPELERRITEALIQDERIESVDDFEFDSSEKRTVKASFTVHTIFGDVQTEKVVNY